MFGRSRPRGLRRLLGAVGLSRLALLAWAWRNRNDLAGWARMAQRIPASLSDPAKRKALLTEAKLRAAITSDAAARAAGVDVIMRDGDAHVVATKGSDAERELALTKLQQRRPDIRIDSKPAADPALDPAPQPGSR